MEGEGGYGNPAHCAHPDKVRRTTLTEPAGYRRGKIGFNNAPKRVCDAYGSEPLPEGVSIPELPEDHAALLGSQGRYPYHGDAGCPYVTEEARLMAFEEGVEAGPGTRIAFVDISEMVRGSDGNPGEAVRDLCDMPRCEKALGFQVYDPNGYRVKVGMHPNGRDTQVWVRNDLVRHGTSAPLAPAQVATVFDLKRFNDDTYDCPHDKIDAVSDWLRGNTNNLGSRPLAGAIGPVRLGGSFRIIGPELVGEGSCADVWVYDKRLFNFEGGLEKPLGQLDVIPEGIIPCMDPYGIFDRAVNNISRTSLSSSSSLSERFNLMGILKPVEDDALRARGLGHEIRIGAVSWRGYHSMSGKFGKDFSEVADFSGE